MPEETTTSPAAVTEDDGSISIQLDAPGGITISQQVASTDTSVSQDPVVSTDTTATDHTNVSPENETALLAPGDAKAVRETAQYTQKTEQAVADAHNARKEANAVLKTVQATQDDLATTKEKLRKQLELAHKQMEEAEATLKQTEQKHEASKELPQKISHKMFDLPDKSEKKDEDQKDSTIEKMANPIGKLFETAKAAKPADIMQPHTVMTLFGGATMFMAFLTLIFAQSFIWIFIAIVAIAQIGMGSIFKKKNS